MPELLRDAGEIVDKTLRDLAVRFGGTFSEADREDIAQEAYRKVLEAHRAGRELRAPLAVVKATARNVALDRLRRGSQEAHPLEEAGALAVSPSPSPETTILTRADLARGIEAAEQLPQKQQAVYRATVIDGLSPVEACRRLSMPRSTFFKYQRAALAYVQSAQLGEASEFLKGEYKLLSAYAFGVATERERARVRRLIANEPHAAALLRELQHGHEAVAATLPALAFEQTVEPGLMERVAALPGRIRDGVYGVVRPETAEVASGPLGTALGGTTGQLAAVCGGVATVACVAAVAPGVGVRAVGDEEQRPGIERSAEAKKQPAPLVVNPAPAVSPVPVEDEAVPPVAAEPSPSVPVEPADAGSQAPAPEAQASEPVPVQEAASSDFTFGAESSSPQPAPTATTSSSSGESGGGGTSGGGGGTEGGDFAFGQ